MSLEWINDIVQAALSFVPQRIIVRPFEAGIACVRGKARLIEPGQIYWYWPFWTDCIIIPTVIQSVDLDDQYCIDNAGNTLAWSAVVTYQVSDPVKICTILNNHNDFLINTALSLVTLELAESSIDAITDDIESFNDTITEQISANLKEYGFDIIGCQLNSIARCTVTRHIHGSLLHCGGVDIKLD